jgi:uncharacterized protein YdbL (DUF1318 family)
MRKSVTGAILALASLVSMAGCITVNIYFPAPEVRKAAEEIVEETWGDQAAGAAATPSSESAPGSSWLAPFLPRAAYAADVDINVSTAAIRTLKTQMKTRADQLKPYLDQGHVGIAKNGTLEVRNLEGVALKDQATVRRLVEAENRDRESLYQEISKANNFEADRIEDVRKIFAETWIAKAEKGWPIQKADGSWTTK